VEKSADLLPSKRGFFIIKSCSTVRRVELLTIKQCRDLLNIQSRDTINEYLKVLGLFGQSHLTWDELKQVLELQIYLGLKHGRNSKEGFKKLAKLEIEQMFSRYGVDVNARLLALQNNLIAA